MIAKPASRGPWALPNRRGFLMLAEREQYELNVRICRERGNTAPGGSAMSCATAHAPHYESDDHSELVDVVTATDCIIALLQDRSARPLFARELLLNVRELKEIGARQFENVL